MPQRTRPRRPLTPPTAHFIDDPPQEPAHFVAVDQIIEDPVDGNPRGMGEALSGEEDDEEDDDDDEDADVEVEEEDDVDEGMIRYSIFEVSFSR